MSATTHTRYHFVDSKLIETEQRHLYTHILCKAIVCEKEYVRIGDDLIVFNEKAIDFRFGLNKGTFPIHTAGRHLIYFPQRLSPQLTRNNKLHLISNIRIKYFITIHKQS